MQKIRQQKNDSARPQVEQPAQPAGQRPDAQQPPAQPPTQPPADTQQPDATGQVPQGETPSGQDDLQIPPAEDSSGQSDPNILAESPVENRERGIYFMQEANGGLALVKVDRRLGVTESPLFDALNALLSGPTDDERQRGIVSLMPEGAKVLSAQVRGTTVYLSFNEGFQYNTYGREGTLAQIRQIVWTATEFANVHDVQFLIEGKRIDFISDGVMIGSPIGR